MKGRQFLDAATSLGSGPSEPFWRAAVGRAYYAALHEALDSLAGWGVSPLPRDPIHSFVRLRFQYAKDADLQSIGTTIEKLCQLRNQAYQLTKIGAFRDAGHAQHAIADAAQAIVLLDQINADVSRRTAAMVATRQSPP